MSQDIAPTQMIPVVTNQGNTPICQSMRWGLVPFWSKMAKPKFASFNARVETVKQKPTFRNAYAKAHTCLIPASGYYEWTGERGHKIKHFIRHQDDSPLVMAGLWEHWQQGDNAFNSCTIITRAAISSLSELHPRMPLILDKENARHWLQPNSLRFDVLLTSLQQYEGYTLSLNIASPN